MFKSIYESILNIFISKDDYIDLLNEANVPAEFHDQAVNSLLQSRYLYWSSVVWHKLTAPIAVAFIVPFMNWADDEVPSWALSYRNNRTPHGDALDWVTMPGGYATIGKAPLDEAVRTNSDGRPLCYWRNGNPHVRETMSRYVWMGLRNPGAGRAYDLGPSIYNAPSHQQADGSLAYDITSYGSDTEPTKNNPGIKVLCLNGNWQILKVSKPSKFLGLFNTGSSCNYGFKVVNAADHYPNDPDARLSVSHIKVPYFA